MPSTGLTEKCQSIIDACLRMNELGINQGTSGNISARYGDMMLITPSGVPYEEVEPRDIAAMPVEGEYGAWIGPTSGCGHFAPRSKTGSCQRSGR